ncbi:ribonuclease H-like domain-containing protein [Tanacetum coccineum]
MSLHYTGDEFDVGDDNNVTLIKTENYQVWSCAMLIALEGKNKTSFIDGSCRRSNTDEVLGKQWDRVNVVVLGLNALWKQFDALIELPRCTCHVADDFKKHNYLMKSAYAIISSEESHRVASGSISGTSQRSQTSAFAVNAPNRRNFQRSQTSASFSRPSNDNRPNDNGNRRTAWGSALVCEKCGFNGHIIDECFKIIGYRADFGEKKARSSFKRKNVFNNNSIGSGSSKGFSDEQMATLISLIKEKRCQ